MPFPFNSPPSSLQSLPLCLAPMAGVSNKIFRLLCKEQGADVVFTELISAEGIIRRDSHTLEYLDFDERERPIGIQFFGASPQTMSEAARIALNWNCPDFIDLNFGCPAPKIVTRQGGAALLKQTDLLKKIAQGVVQAVDPFPITAKIRLGWDNNQINVLTVAKVLEDCGIRALTVHGRTKEQGYGGKADWEKIAQVAESVSIPVIGNGDISKPEDVRNWCSGTKIAGVMIGRAAMSAPWIFAAIKEYFSTGKTSPPPSMERQWEFIRRHCRLEVEHLKNEAAAMRAMRARLMAYTKGMPGAKHLRGKFQQVSSLGELEEIANTHLHPR